jgi:DNA-binding transcriptional LysR family regulator
LDHLHSFLLLAEELHFGRAGRRLHVSVAGLSRRISQLERAVGQQLVHRRNPPLRLTEAGERMTVVARVILDEVRSLP